MTPDHTSRELVELLHAVPPAAEDGSPVLDAWRQAAADADQAYDAWQQAPDVDVYVRYLAAEDRAVTAEDQLWASAGVRYATERDASPVPA